MKWKGFLQTLFTGKNKDSRIQYGTVKSDDTKSNTFAEYIRMRKIQKRHEREEKIRKDHLKGIQELLEKALFEISVADVDEVMKAGQAAIEKDHRFDITPEDMLYAGGMLKIDRITEDDSSWFILKQTDKLFCALFFLATKSCSWEMKADRYLCIPEDYILPEGICEMLFFKAVLAEKNYSHYNNPHVYLTRVSGEGRQYRFLNLLTNSIWEDTIDTYAGFVDDAATYGWRSQKECIK